MNAHIHTQSSVNCTCLWPILSSLASVNPATPSGASVKDSFTGRFIQRWNEFSSNITDLDLVWTAYIYIYIRGHIGIFESTAVQIKLTVLSVSPSKWARAISLIMYKDAYAGFILSLAFFCWCCSCLLVCFCFICVLFFFSFFCHWTFHSVDGVVITFLLQLHKCITYIYGID